MDSVSKEFIRYLVETEKFFYYAKYNAEGTAIKNLSLKSMKNFKFKIPPFEEKKKSPNISRL